MDTYKKLKQTNASTQ